jgi:hypothetical protein
MTPEQFRAAFCLSRRAYDALKRCRLAPREVCVRNRKKLITLQDAAQWRVDAEGLLIFALSR